MKELDILNIIKDIDNQYKYYNDGGVSFIKHLAKKILNTVDEDKAEVFKFFLKEIKNNENGLGEIALLTIVELGASEKASDIERIYKEVAHLKSDSWKHSIIEALMKMRYSKSKALYFEYVNAYLIKNPDSSYFLLVQYCNVDPEKALPLLSDFYVKYLLGDKQMRNFLESRIGFLLSYFIKNPIDYLPELIRETLRKNKETGVYLKNLLIRYFKSDMVNQYPKTTINSMLENLKTVVI